MQFSYSNHGNSSKATKFMLVAGLHLVIGTVFVRSIDIRKMAVSLPEPVLVMLEPTRLPPPPPPEPPKPVQQQALPDLVVPKVEVPAVQPPPEPTVRAAVETETPPQPATPSSVASEGPPATTPSTNTGQMNSAVFADANSCALPDYPASAARDGQTGTTTLALLVGADGRVSSARIDHSSGSQVLDRAAMKALSLCKFKPAVNNGAPAAGWAQLAYVWKLD